MLLAFLFTLVMLPGLARYGLDADMDDFLPDSVRRARDDLARLYPNRDHHLAILLEAQGEGGVLRASVRRDVDALVQAINLQGETADLVERLIDPVGALHHHPNQPPAAGPHPRVVEHLLELRPLWKHLFNSAPGADPPPRKALLLVQLDTFERSPEELEAAELAIAEQVRAHQTPRLRATAFSRALAESALLDSMVESLWVVGLGVVVALGVVFWALRSVLDTAACLVAFCLAVLWTFGAAGYLGFRLSPLALAAPALLVALGVDFAIHLLARYQEESRRCGPGEAAMLVTLHRTGRGVLLAGATTAAGFAANVFAPSRALEEFGLTLALAIVAALGVSLVVLPAYRVLLDGRAAGLGDDAGAATLSQAPAAACSPLAVGFRPRLTGLLLLVGAFVGLAVCAASTPVSMDWRLGLTSDHPLVQAADVLEAEFPGVVARPIEVHLAGSVARREVLEALAVAIADLDDQDWVVMRGERAWVRSPLQVFEDDTGRAVLPQDGSALASKLSEAGGIGGRAYGFVAFSDAQPTGMRVEVRVRGSLWDTAAQARAVAGVREVFSGLSRVEGIEVVLGGEPVYRVEHVLSVTRSVLRTTAVAAVVCALLLGLALRSPLGALLCLFPACLTALGVVALLGVLPYGLNGATGAVIPVALGVAVDYAVHIVRRFQEERERCGDPTVATSVSLRALARPLLASAGTTTLGIGVGVLAAQGYYRQYAILLGAAAASACVVSVLFLWCALPLIGRRV